MMPASLPAAVSRAAVADARVPGPSPGHDAARDGFGQHFDAARAPHQPDDTKVAGAPARPASVPAHRDAAPDAEATATPADDTPAHDKPESSPDAPTPIAVLLGWAPPLPATGGAMAAGQGATSGALTRLAQQNMGAATMDDLTTAAAAEATGATLPDSTTNAAATRLPAWLSLATSSATPQVHDDATGTTTDDAQASTGSLFNALPLGAPAGMAAAPHSLVMSAPAGSGAFAHELGQQVVWLGGQTLKEASIRLQPEALGKLEVKVQLGHDGRVDVAFLAQHPAAVTAVQQSLADLGMLLAGQGLSLGQAQVGQQGARAGGGSAGRSAGANEEGESALSPVAAPHRPVALGLLDTFA